jgi:hypothetical protein
MGSLSPTHKPDYSMTEPPVDIPPNKAWFDSSKIVSFDPWGHLVPQVFRKEIEELGLDIRPSIAVTKAHIKLSEIDEASRKGTIPIDGKIVLKSRPLLNADSTESTADPGVEIVSSKAAVEPVWYLPGVAERFGMYVIDMRSCVVWDLIFFPQLREPTSSRAVRGYRRNVSGAYHAS